jgi:UDP-N-acetylmuramoyl-L-alanyl-D-glutamate--2,6-diaminopimelate ligase
MQLRELIAELNLIEVHGSTSMEIAGISYDARRVLPGDLYVALQRGTHDGHAEIELALERGAVAVVCRRLGNLRQRLTRIEVADTRVALAEVARVFYGNAGTKLHVIGISGGADAWKTAHLTKQLLQAGGVKTGLISSLRHEVGERSLPSAHFSEPSDIQRLFAGMVRSGCTACVLELPAISPANLKGIPLNVLLYQGGEQNIRALSVFLQSRRDAPVCGIVNVDDESGRSVVHSSIFKMQLGYGFSASAEISASEVSCTATGTSFILNLAGHSAACEVPVIGSENVRHLLGAAAASLSSLTPRQVLSAMAAVRSAPSALEAVPNDLGITIFVDGAAVATSLHSVLEDVSKLTSGRLLMAFGAESGGTGRDRFDLGKTAAQFADHIILTSDNPAGEDPESICAVIAQGIESVGQARYHLQLDRVQAIRELIAMAEPGDTVIVTGKGERTHQILGSTVIPFNDREVAVDCLQNFVKPRMSRNVTTELCAA